MQVNGVGLLEVTGQAQINPAWVVIILLLQPECLQEGSCGNQQAGRVGVCGG